MRRIRPPVPRPAQQTAHAGSSPRDGSDSRKSTRGVRQRSGRRSSFIILGPHGCSGQCAFRLEFAVAHKSFRQWTRGTHLKPYDSRPIVTPGQPARKSDDCKQGRTVVRSRFPMVLARAALCLLWNWADRSAAISRLPFWIAPRGTSPTPGLVVRIWTVRPHAPARFASTRRAGYMSFPIQGAMVAPMVAFCLVGLRADDLVKSRSRTRRPVPGSTARMPTRTSRRRTTSSDTSTGSGSKRPKFPATARPTATSTSSGTRPRSTFEASLRRPPIQKADPGFRGPEGRRPLFQFHGRGPRQ